MFPASADRHNVLDGCRLTLFMWSTAPIYRYARANSHADTGAQWVSADANNHDGANWAHTDFYTSANIHDGSSWAHTDFYASANIHDGSSWAHTDFYANALTSATTDRDSADGYIVHLHGG